MIQENKNANNESFEALPIPEEAVILEAARSPGFNINKLLAAMNNAEEIH